MHVDPVDECGWAGSWVKMGPWLLRFGSRVVCGVGSSLGRCAARSYFVTVGRGVDGKGSVNVRPCRRRGREVWVGDGMDWELGVLSPPANPAPRGFQTWKEIDWEI